ncbi:MAG TPA: hypothetical protein DCY03_18560 [Planctomycetaceae bacterium]|nr:hypothetical protein [Planctomycetaceae bacterium]
MVTNPMINQLKLPADYFPRVYIVDDDEAVRSSIIELIGSMGFQAIGFASAEDFISKTDNQICGCVLSDLRMLGCNGIELLKLMKSKGYEIPFIILSAYVDVTNTVAAMSEGALTVLEKPYPEQELWDCIITAILLNSEQRQGRSWLWEFQKKEKRLTQAESEVLKLLLKGCSNKSISHLLELSQRTIVMRRKSILQKFEVENLIDLTKLITKAQIIQKQLPPWSSMVDTDSFQQDS